MGWGGGGLAEGRLLIFTQASAESSALGAGPIFEPGTAHILNVGRKGFLHSTRHDLLKKNSILLLVCSRAMVEADVSWVSWSSPPVSRRRCPTWQSTAATPWPTAPPPSRHPHTSPPSSAAPSMLLGKRSYRRGQTKS
jgi:hypothetical protein